MYSQREIVLVPFPYSDLSATKRRPVLVISNNNYNKQFPDILVCVITSNLFKDEYSVELNDKDLLAGILPERSVIKCHKLFTVEQSQIVKRFSVISEEKMQQVKHVLQQLIQ
ncbi:MAG: type II toxin-antitoxin system PemK/MazF family toxin [Chitinophagaceae bacterium]|nr:MAG: type II toxin-antitoxin system PemK/MazF family toxin [Chitinophagaceae bacterium]